MIFVSTKLEIQKMRQIETKQLPLTSNASQHKHTRRLEVISDILDSFPHLAELARKDLVGTHRTDVGRDGMTGEQVIRVALLKQMHNLNYRELAFRLEDSSVFRRFSRMPYGKPIKHGKLQSNVKRLSSATWEAIQKVLVQYAEENGIETGRKTRTDCTVVESNIHEPSDSSLLYDCVRVVIRILFRVSEEVPEASLTFHDHCKRAKRRALEIKFPRSKKDKTKHRERSYRDLLKVAGQTYNYGVIALTVLANTIAKAPLNSKLQALHIELGGYLTSMEKVQDQTRRRVLKGEKVPAHEKIVSIFETHTDIIVKDKRETQFGHKICLTGGASSMIIDCVIEDGNPADSTLVERSIQRQTALYGRPPRQVSFDGGFASKPNLELAKSLGVEDVVYHKKRGLEIRDMAKSDRVYKRLKNFRAGIEGCISALKRAFGLDRATWRGLHGFKSYVWSSVVSFNALVIAKYLIA